MHFLHFISFINTSSSNYNIFEHIRNTQNIPPQMTKNHKCCISYGMNTSIHEMWIKTMCDLVASNGQIFLPIFVSLLATPERNGRNFNSIYPTKCPSSKKVSSLLFCCLSNCGKENKEVWHKWRMLIQIEIQKKTWAIFIFLIFLKCPCNCIELSLIKDLKCTYTGGGVAIVNVFTN